MSKIYQLDIDGHGPNCTRIAVGFTFARKVPLKLGCWCGDENAMPIKVISMRQGAGEREVLTGTDDLHMAAAAFPTLREEEHDPPPRETLSGRHSTQRTKGACSFLP